MDFNMEWNAICRICLHESDDMRSIFDIDSDTSVLLIDKIRQCSTVVVSWFLLFFYYIFHYSLYAEMYKFINFTIL